MHALMLRIVFPPGYVPTEDDPRICQVSVENATPEKREELRVIFATGSIARFGYTEKEFCAETEISVSFRELTEDVLEAGDEAGSEEVDDENDEEDTERHFHWTWKSDSSADIAVLDSDSDIVYNTMIVLEALRLALYLPKEFEPGEDDDIHLASQWRINDDGCHELTFFYIGLRPQLYGHDKKSFCENIHWEMTVKRTLIDIDEGTFVQAPSADGSEDTELVDESSFGNWLGKEGLA